MYYYYYYYVCEWECVFFFLPRIHDPSDKVRGTYMHRSLVVYTHTHIRTPLTIYTVEQPWVYIPFWSSSSSSSDYISRSTSCCLRATRVQQARKSVPPSGVFTVFTRTVTRMRVKKKKKTSSNNTHTRRRWPYSFQRIYCFFALYNRMYGRPIFNFLYAHVLSAYAGGTRVD